MELSDLGPARALLESPLFGAEWVLWLLLGLSVLSVAVALERWVFFIRRRVDLPHVRAELARLLEAGQPQAAIDYLAKFDTLETNVALFGLRGHAKGPDAVTALLDGATEHEQMRYERRLGLLATVGSNAPFVGLFGTVLGIIRAFADLAGDMGNASHSVMAGISEALIATAVGLLVAIPAVVAYNALSGRVRTSASGATVLAKTLMAELEAEPPAEVS